MDDLREEALRRRKREELRKELVEEEVSKEEEELWREERKVGDEVVEGLNELVVLRMKLTTQRKREERETREVSSDGNEGRTRDERERSSNQRTISSSS